MLDDSLSCILQNAAASLDAKLHKTVCRWAAQRHKVVVVINSHYLVLVINPATASLRSGA